MTWKGTSSFAAKRIAWVSSQSRTCIVNVVDTANRPDARTKKGTLDLPPRRTNTHQARDRVVVWGASYPRMDFVVHVDSVDSRGVWGIYAASCLITHHQSTRSQRKRCTRQCRQQSRVTALPFSASTVFALRVNSVTYLSARRLWVTLGFFTISLAMVISSSLVATMHTELGHMVRSKAVPTVAVVLRLAITSSAIFATSVMCPGAKSTLAR